MITRWSCWTFLADNGRYDRPRRDRIQRSSREKPPMFSLCGRSIQRTVLPAALPRRVAAVQSGIRGITSNVNTVDASEIELFSRLSSQWWDERGEFAMLHKMNPVRMEFIKEKLQEIQLEEECSPTSSSATPLEGLDILDVGCGGGLLSEVRCALSAFFKRILKENCQSLARLGARTTGIDASEANIGIASTHAAGDPQFARSAQSLKYLYTTAEALLAKGKQYDVVCSMEVIEHVNMPSEFLHACAQLVKVRDSFRFFHASLTHAFATYSFLSFSPEVICSSPPSHVRPWRMH